MGEAPIPARYAILLELLRSGPLRASDLVEPTGLTLQGVSYHLKQLEGEGLVTHDGQDRKGLRLTQAGVERLHEHFLGLKSFVDLALSELLPVEECVAIAETDLSEGQQVGLFMEDGRLIARAAPSPSEGHVRASAKRGEPVVIAGLSGVVDLVPGHVHVLRLPPPLRLPTAKALAARVEEEGLSWDTLVVSGLEAEHLARRADLEGLLGASRFAPGAVARNAAQLGLDVLVLASWDTAQGVIEAIQEGAGPTMRGPQVTRVDL